MTRVLLLILTLLPATPAVAVPVKIQSGEHDGFTRLVFELPEKTTPWAVSGQGRRYEIVVDGEDIDYVTNAVFNRISRSRLAALVRTKRRNRLVLDLNCECRVRTQPFGERYLILDIVDAPEGPKEFQTRQYSFGLKPVVPSRDMRFRFSPKRDEVVSRLGKPTAELIDETLSPTRYLKRVMSLKTSQQELLQELGRAVSQEFLQPVLKNEQIRRPPANSDSTKRAVPTLEPASVAQEKAPSNMTTYSTTNFDNSLRVNALSGLERDCVPPEELDIASWADDTPVSQQIAPLRSRLYGEFDQIDGAVARQLARLYLHYTFGAEARQVLSLGSFEDEATLRDLSNVVDGGPFDSSVLAEQAGCPGTGTFWAVLANADALSDENVQDVVRTFNEFPRHLREVFAPRLSVKLAELGHVEAAELVLNAVERVTPDPEPSVQLAKANVARIQNDPDTAFQSLSELTSGNSDITPQALVDLIDLHVERQLPPDKDVISLVGAFAVEHGAAPIGIELRRAHFLARLEGAQFAQALNVLDEVQAKDGAEQAKTLRDIFGLRLAERASDFEFVALLVRNELTRPESFSAQVSLELATRFFDLGFLQEARQMLQSTQELVGLPDRRILLAKIAIEDGFPRRAEAALLGLEGDVANRLRAEARRRAGDHSEAMEIYRQLGDTAEADRQAWLQSDWPALANSETVIYRDVSRLTNTPGVSVAPGLAEPLSSGVLARNRGLLDVSADTRTTLTELLQLHRGPSLESN